MRPIPTPPGRGSAAAPTPTPVSLREDPRRAGSVHDYARRMAFLTELDSQTWISRYTAAERLGDPDAVTSVARYLAWLRRMSTAWTAVPMPSVEQAEAVWPFSALPASGLDVAGWVEADLRDVALSAGGPHPGRGRHAATMSTTMSTSIGAVNALGGAEAAREDVDAAYVAGAAYVVVTLAQEVAVLAADVEHLSATSARTDLPQRYLRHCLHVASVRGPMRRELAAWADEAGPDAAERVVLAARMLTDQLASALIGGGHPGW